MTAFTDWQKATADIAFAETQLTAIKQLADTKVDAQQKLVARMKKLVAAGTDTEKDLAAAQADLIQAQIQGRKDVHEAETAVRLAKRTEAALARQLQQGGLDPDLLRSTTWDVDIVMADVPEGLMSQVKIGQACEARFLGFPSSCSPARCGQSPPCCPRSVAPCGSCSPSAIRTTCFAPACLPTSAWAPMPDSALLAPAEAIVHVGRADYVLVREGSDDWRVTDVQVGELHKTSVEVLGGLHAGDKIAGQGVILLKPCIIEALQTPASTQALQAQTGRPARESRL